MLTPELPEDQKVLAVPKQPARVVLREGDDRPLTIVLPPFDDIAEIEWLQDKNFSLDEFHKNETKRYQEAFEGELSGLLLKYEKYSKSSVYLNRLANLAAFAGDRVASDRYIKEALEFSNEESNSRFYQHRYGASLVENSSMAAAETFFGSLNLTRDLTANLRLASFSVQKSDLNSANKFVEVALSIDPCDFGARLFRGGLDLMEKEYQKAIHNFRMAANERPGSSSVHCNMAIAYLGLNDDHKALSCLKRSVALDPLNVNAVSLLADLAFILKKDEDAVPSLRYLAQFEQKNIDVWSRLARGCLRISNVSEAIAALKRQASVRDASDVWNNLGVAYIVSGSKQRAMESFVHAMRIDGANPTQNYFLAARNVAQMLIDNGRIEQAKEFSEDVLSKDYGNVVPRDRMVSDLVIIYVYALTKCASEDVAVKVARSFLSIDGIVDKLAVWLVSLLLSERALRGDAKNAVDLADEYNSVADGLEDSDLVLKHRYVNNVAFALAELGKVDEAHAVLSRIMNTVHHEAYATATFGLIQIKKGRFERGFALYKEAMGLALGRVDKSRIKQKMNLELGKHWLNTDRAKAVSVLKKVVDQSGGESALVRQALGIINSVR